MLYNLAAEYHFALMKGFGTLGNSRWLTRSNYRLLNITYIILIYSYTYNRIKCVCIFKRQSVRWVLDLQCENVSKMEEPSQMSAILGALFGLRQPRFPTHIALCSGFSQGAGLCWQTAGQGGNASRDVVWRSALQQMFWILSSEADV